MTFLLSIGAKLLARPAVLAAVIGALVFGIREFQHWREVGGLEKQIAELTSQRNDQERQKLEFKAALSDVTANRDALAADLRRQNDAVGLLQLKAKEQETVASLAAVRAFNQGRAAAEALRQPTTVIAPGHEPMNTWLAERFGGQ
jgi:hypothetical protein